MLLVGKDRYYSDSSRLTLSFLDGQRIDPNHLSAHLVAPCILAFMNGLSNRRRRNRLFYFGAALLIVVGIFSTGSRGALLALLAGLFSVVFFSKKRSVSRLFAYAVLAGIGLIVVIKVIPSEMVSRFFDVRTWMDASNKRRFQLWLNAWEAIKSSPVLGHGLSSTGPLIGAVTGTVSPAHNTYLETWVQMGGIAVAIILYLMLDAFKNASSAYIKGVIVATAVFSVFISAEMNFYFWFNIIFCISYNRTIGKSQNQVRRENLLSERK
jgi:O-antigen ligase